jgi:NAD(P)-dependent dehydrogenase (short-subunit alcohol dehydrogenase family)
LPEWWRELQLSKIPFGRYGTIEDTVATVMFLLSEGGSFFTGQVLSPNGGDFMA